MPVSQMKVAYILTPITFGGAEKVSLNFLRSVNRDRFDIRPVLLVRPWEDESYFAGELRNLGYACEAVPVALRTDYDPIRVPRVAYRLFSFLKNGGFCLVHTHGYFADTCGQPAARLLGVSGISTCHGFISTDLKLRLYNSLDKYALRLCRKIIAVSEGIRTELVRSGISDSKIAVVPNAVSLSHEGADQVQCRIERRNLLHIDPVEHVIGYLGRLSVEKGLPCLIQAASKLLEEKMRVRLLIVGDGPERANLEWQAKAAGLDGKVLFTGFQKDPEDWYPVCDSFVLPSLTEGTPLALLEAMAAGVPVVASAVGGVPKVVIDGVNGLLTSPGDVGAIQEKLQLLIADADFSRRLGRAGRESVQANFGIHSWCRAIENCYDEI